jgi:RimJ/RimL family protein N-acetyltransferase
VSTKYIPKEVKLKDGQLMTIRKPSPKDAEMMIEYLNIVGGESDNLLISPGEFHLTVQEEQNYIENITNNENALMLLGVVDNKIISISQISSPNRKRIQHNSDIAISVKKEFWNLGVGTAILGELLQFAREHELIKNVRLGVRAVNYNAIKLYEKCGFKPVGLHKDYFCINGNFYDEILMEQQVK